MAGFDITKPADTDLVRNYPTLARTDKTTLQTQLQVEHDVLDGPGAATGRHKFPSGNTASRPGTPPTGAIYVNTQLGIIEQWDGAAWQPRAIAFAGGGTVKLVFNMAAAPTGWTRVVDVANTGATIILRTNSEVPGVGGSWTVSGLTAGGTSDSFTLSEAEIPSHTHTLNDPTHTHGVGFRSGSIGANAPVLGSGGGGIDGTETSDAASTGASILATGGGGGHAHTISAIAVSSTGAWRPKYVDMIVASKD